MRGDWKVTEEQAGDVAGVRRVNQLAFGRAGEAELVDRLRKGCGAIVSLVVREGSEVIGHAMFSPVTIESGERAVMGMGLGPVAVEPGFQRRGVGKSLISVGLEKVEEVGSPFVVVLGHPEYYPRFGFERASRFGIRCAWDVPDDVFMVRVFDAQAMEGVSGVARYRGEFDAVT